MAGFLYYFPGGQGADAETFVKAGLGPDLVAGASFSHVGVLNNGPDGGKGSCVTMIPDTPDARAAKTGVYMDRQRWLKGPEGKFWIGYEIESPPRPQDLARKVTLVSHPVKLGDGKEWQVPVARHYSLAGSPLPKAIALDDNLEAQEEILPEYQRYSKAAETIFFWFWSENVRQPLPEESGINEDEPRPRLGLEDMLQISAMALGFNYRVSRLEVGFLKLITTQLIEDVYFAILDIPRLQMLKEARDRIEKKKLGDQP